MDNIHGEIRDESKILAGKCDRKRPLERPTCRWGNNNVTDLINALPGNNSVNTVQHATIEESVVRVRGDFTQRWVVVM
jgi:hypothetical protein